MSARRVLLPPAVHAERHLTVVSTYGAAGRALAVTLLLLCALLAGGPLAVLLSGDTSPPTVIATVVGAGIALAGAAWIVREWRRPPPDTVVSDIGVLGDAAAGWANDIRWDQVRGDPSRPADVWVAMPAGRHEALRWLHFFTAERPGGPLVERKLRLLIPGKVGCLAYANGFELRRAVLLQLATRVRPPLRFDPMLFVELGVHPRRWTRMPWPGRVLATLVGVPMVVLFAATFHFMDALPSVWWTVGVLVAGMVGSVVAALLLFARLYPSFSGDPYTFTAPP